MEMNKQSFKKKLGQSLPENIRILSRLIARKSSAHTKEYAYTIEDSFSKYTRTNIINILRGWNDELIDYDWPFPSYLNINNEIKKIMWEFDQHLSKLRFISIPLSVILRGPSSLTLSFLSLSDSPRPTYNFFMTYIFMLNQKKIFSDLLNSPVLESKRKVIEDIKQAYRRGMWAACITTTIPIFDYTIRAFLGSNRLMDTIQVLRDAFLNEANLSPTSIMPGFSHGDSNIKDNEKPFFDTLEEDLRLPGVFLSSFFEFSDRYYEWHNASDIPVRSQINRHAIMHGSYNYWSRANAARIISFLHLLISLETPLKILIHGNICESADQEGAKGGNP